MATARDNDGQREPTNRRGLSNEDAQLWRWAIADVTPLREARQQAPNSAAGPAASASASPPATPRRQLLRPPPHRPPAYRRSRRARWLPRARHPPTELEPGKATGIDKRTVARLRRGLIAPETQIDLHQHTQEQAHRLLDGFLDASQASGRRCVLVITGKGRRSGGDGVLRTMVPRWLNEQPNRRRVLAFCHAVPAHGGDGALYVLLRKSRPPRHKRSFDTLCSRSSLGLFRLAAGSRPIARQGPIPMQCREADSRRHQEAESQTELS